MEIKKELRRLRDKYHAEELLTRQETFWLIHELSKANYAVEEFKKQEQQSEDYQRIIRQAKAWREANKPVVIDNEKWIITLNKYQRDNLLWLFAAIGYASDSNGNSGVPPFTLANNGDWVGEIPQMLQKTDAKEFCKLDPEDIPNGINMRHLQHDVDHWLARQERKTDVGKE